MPEPYTIRIFVPDGEPDGIRIIDRMNWTGVGIAFPRDKWQETKKRTELQRAGVYILVGYREDDDLPALYIGQSNVLVDRIENHVKNKDFWNSAIVFTSPNGGLNTAHVTWLEYAIIEKANNIGRCHMENGNTPLEPPLDEPEKANCRNFLKEILQILPLVGVHALEKTKAVATPGTTSADVAINSATNDNSLDTVVVPAQQDGFKDVFLGQNCWYSIRISGGKLDKIKFIAAYQSAPISAITHWAPVHKIEPYGDDGKYKLVFSESAKQIGPIPFGDAPKGTMQGPRYTSIKKLLKAQKLSELF